MEKVLNAPKSSDPGLTRVGLEVDAGESISTRVEAEVGREALKVRESLETLLRDNVNLDSQSHDIERALGVLSAFAGNQGQHLPLADKALGPISSSLKDLQLRLRLWRSDVGDDVGALINNPKFQLTSLYDALSTCFEDLRLNIREVYHEIRGAMRGSGSEHTTE